MFSFCSCQSFLSCAMREQNHSFGPVLAFRFFFSLSFFNPFLGLGKLPYLFPASPVARKTVVGSRTFTFCHCRKDVDFRCHALRAAPFPPALSNPKDFHRSRKFHASCHSPFLMFFLKCASCFLKKNWFCFVRKDFARKSLIDCSRVLWVPGFHFPFARVDLPPVHRVSGL